MIVTDTNVLAMLFLGTDEERSASVDLAEIESEWVAPSLWMSEWLSVLKQHMNARGLSKDGACAAFHEAFSFVRSVHRDPVPEHVLELSQSSGCSTYDCEFVALAMELDVPLVTLDRRVARAFPGLVMDPRTASGRSRSG